MKQKAAFTLIELAIALTILAILISMVVTFYPKVIKILKMRRAISYVEDNIDALKGQLISSTITYDTVRNYLPHPKDVYGSSMAYFQGVGVDDKHICVLKKTHLRICTISDYNKYRDYMNNTNGNGWDPANNRFFECNQAGGMGDDAPVALVILSPGPNRNIQTPILCTDADHDGTCNPEDDNSADYWTIPIFKSVPPTKKFDDYYNPNGERQWRKTDASSDEPYPNENTPHAQTYDDIIRYLPLSLAKANCPPTDVVANIDRFWANASSVDVSSGPATVRLYWIVSYAGDNVNQDEVKCMLDLGNGTTIELNWDECIGSHSTNATTDPVFTSAGGCGVKVPMLKVFDDTGQMILMKTTDIAVSGCGGFCNSTDLNFVIKSYYDLNGTENNVNSDILNNVSAPITVNFEWNGTALSGCSDLSCFVDFGDQSLSGEIPNCSQTTSISHTYQYSVEMKHMH
jgi:prepilin-type N-terminal cleavage/methylation domain-containing protein